MREYLDEAVHSRRQLQGLTALPVLAVLPQLAGDDPIALEALGSAMQSLYDSLVEGDRNRRGRAILVSSTTAAEGKTTVALNLALAAAGRGKRVLLVDADFERHTLSNNPAAKASAGLFDLIEGRVKLASVLFSESGTGLSFLPLGEARRPESRHPRGEDIVLKLTEPGRMFDLVIVDSGAVSSDSYVAPFADAVDDILFVVRAGTTGKDEITRALASMRANARKIRGTILTGASEDLA
jgi:Mrp family chromosome partitioning ATPase